MAGVEPQDVNPANQPYNSTFMAGNASQQLVPISLDRVDTQIQRLNGKNWPTWKWQLFNVLDAKGLRDVITGNSVDPPGSPREIATRQILSGSIDQSLITKIVHCTNAHEIWKCLTSIYENQTSMALTVLRGKMNTYKIKNVAQVEEGISEIQSLAVQIEAMGGPMDYSTVESAILNSLPSSFVSFISSWSFLDHSQRTLSNLQAHLMQHVTLMRLHEKKDTKALAVKASNSQGKSNNSKKNSKKFSGNCNYCKKPGHLVKDCLKLKKKKESEEKKNSDGKDESSSTDKSDDSKKTEPSDKLALMARADKVCSSRHPPTDEFVSSKWIPDSGCSFHITPRIEWLADYQELDGQMLITVGNGQRARVRGHGFIETSFGILTPVYFVPEVVENLFSVSSCAKYHEVITVYNADEVILYKDGNPILSVSINANGTYDLCFEVKIASKVAMLATSLSDWHSRLGHVSTQTIKHMVSNGAVSGLIISDE